MQRLRDDIRYSYTHCVSGVTALLVRSEIRSEKIAKDISIDPPVQTSPTLFATSSKYDFLHKMWFWKVTWTLSSCDNFAWRSLALLFLVSMLGWFPSQLLLYMSILAKAGLYLIRLVLVEGCRQKIWANSDTLHVLHRWNSVGINCPITNQIVINEPQVSFKFWKNAFPL